MKVSDAKREATVDKDKEVIQSVRGQLKHVFLKKPPSMIHLEG
jgi:hypothetical protein